MKFVFIVVISAIVVMSFLCRNYGKGITGSSDKKHNILKAFDGFSMLLLDKCFWRIIEKFRKNTADKISTLSVSDNAENSLYIYSFRKMSVCIGVTLLIMIIGLCICISNDMNETVIVTLERPQTPEAETEYRLEAVIENGETEDINVTVSGRQYSDEEIENMLQDKYDELIAEMLGDNESLDYVTQNLNFVSSLTDEVKVSWSSKNEELINGSGQITENIDEDGELAEIEAVLSYGSHEVCYTITVCLYPVEESEKTIQEKVQEAIDEQADSGSSIVELPDNIDGEDIYFSSGGQIGMLAIVFMAIIFPIAIFILKDRDLDAQIKKRNVQMMCDYPEIAGKMQLFIAAGMTVNRAWERIVEDYETEIAKKKRTERFAYEEMKLSLNKMKSGVSQISCYSQFGSRCRLHSYLKLSSLLEQNVKRGTKGIDRMLDEEVKDSFEQRKNLAKKLGEEASTKMLLPMIMMLIITIVIIVVPALISVDI